MSGRTNALRTSVVGDQAFLDALVSERDLSRPDSPLLLAGENKFITRWLSDHGIEVWVQYRYDTYLEATLDLDEGFLFSGETTTSCFSRLDSRHGQLHSGQS